MDKSSLTPWSCIGSLFICMSVQLISLIVIAQSFERDSLAQQTLPSLSRQKLCDLANSITVKIMLLDGSTRGSGFLVSREGTVYTIVTNKHVLSDANQYKIQTKDGLYYIATRVPFDSNDDLALLNFQPMSGEYEIAKPESGLNLDSQTGEPVIAAGFAKKTLASKSVEFICTQLVNTYRVLNQPMKLGYQIGFLFSINEGMSGGPLLNSQGKVVGVNGKGSPLWGGERSPKEVSELFLYEKDNSSVLDLLSPEEQRLIIKFNWAIPIDTVDTQMRQARLRGICPIAVKQVIFNENKKDIEEKINVLIGNSLFVYLNNDERNPESPFTWQMANGNNVKNLKLENPNPSTERDKQVFHFQAISEGISRLDFFYGTPPEAPNQSKSRTFSVTVKTASHQCSLN